MSSSETRRRGVAGEGLEPGYLETLPCPRDNPPADPGRLFFGPLCTQEKTMIVDTPVPVFSGGVRISFTLGNICRHATFRCVAHVRV